MQILVGAYNSPVLSSYIIFALCDNDQNNEWRWWRQNNVQSWVEICLQFARQLESQNREDEERMEERT